MNKKLKGLLSCALCLTLAIAAPVQAYAATRNMDNKNIYLSEDNKFKTDFLLDTDDIRKVKIENDGDTAIATYYKKDNRLEIINNGHTTLIDLNKNSELNKSLNIDNDIIQRGPSIELMRSNRVSEYSYKQYYILINSSFQWEVAKGSSQKNRAETGQYRDNLEKFADAVDKMKVAHNQIIASGAGLAAGASITVSGVIDLSKQVGESGNKYKAPLEIAAGIFAVIGSSYSLNSSVFEYGSAVSSANVAWYRL